MVKQVAAQWSLDHVTHINALVDGYEASVEHFRDRVGFTLDREIPDAGDGTDACLMSLGRQLFELFAPKGRAEGQGKLLTKLGEHYLGVEYRVPSVADAREVAQEQGVRIINDRGGVFFTYPGSVFGIGFEIWDGDLQHFRKHDQPLTFWEDEHPMALSGLSHISVAVTDLDQAVQRIQTLAGVQVDEQVERSAVHARGVRINVGDRVWELLEPTGPGAVADFLEQYGPKIRSTAFRTKDIDKVHKHLTGNGLDLIPGDSEGALAIEPSQNHGLHMQFVPVA
jgi:catechol 2,3-dioxygenase-like lactoylglutathione lyase family enzyme